MLDFAERFCALYDAAQAFIVEFICGGAGGTPGKNSTHRNYSIHFRNILVNRIVRETRKRRAAAGDEDFSFVGGGEAPKFLEDIVGLIVV